MDYAQRRQRVQAAMGEAGTDLLALAHGDNMVYLLGFSPVADERPCYLLLTARAAAYVVPALNQSQALAHVDLPMYAYTDEQGAGGALAEAARSLQLGQVQCLAVDDTMRADFVLALRAVVPEAELSLGSAMLGPLRMRKSPAELAALQRASDMGDQAMAAAFQAVRAGVSEQRVAEAAAAAFAAAGAERVDFTIVGAGANGAFPHHHTSSRVLASGDAVVIDIGATLDGYHSDLTRMAFVGEPPPVYREVHAVVDTAVQAALAAVKPGVPASAVDQAARRVITEAGYGEYFTHRTGHGIGLNVHEPPYITGANPVLLGEGMTFSIEPGIYLPGRFGVRLEEIVAVTAQGARVLSRLDRQVRCIPA